MAAGRPIVASLNGEGARIGVVAKAGMACPAGDALALAKTLRKLASLPGDDRVEMGENARRYAQKHFSLDRLADQLAEYLRVVYSAYREKRQ
jgi:glycosyltransferase involved in cell wall biosynthesis